MIECSPCYFVLTRHAISFKLYLSFLLVAELAYADAVFQESPVVPAKPFVNREIPMRRIAECISDFVVEVDRIFAMGLRNDSIRNLVSMFAVGMFGWGKTELGLQILLFLMD